MVDVLRRATRDYFTADPPTTWTCSRWERPTASNLVTPSLAGFREVLDRGGKPWKPPAWGHLRPAAQAARAIVIDYRARRWPGLLPAAVGASIETDLADLISLLADRDPWPGLRPHREVEGSVRVGKP